VIPEENRKDLVDLPKSVLQGLEIVPAKWIDEVLDVVLERPLLPLAAGAKEVATDTAETAKELAKADDGGADAGRAH
jgi:ATP-dependent Lon protease